MKNFVLKIEKINYETSHMRGIDFKSLLIDWKKLIVFIKENEIDNMPKMLTEIVDSGKYNEMLEYGNYCYSKYFNLKFVSSYIKNTVEFFK